MDVLTYQYFMQESSRFREIMGDKAIMTDENRRAGALKGYAHVYFNMKCSDEELERAAITFESQVDEFNRRALYMDLKI